MFPKTALIIIFASLATVNCDCSVDNQEQVKKCYDEYLSKLEHYSYINSFDDYQLSVSYYMENWTKIVVLCNEFQALSTCIETTNVKNCINKNDFKGVKTVWNDNSTLFTTNYHTLNYMCGKGMKALTPSYECLHLFRNNSVQCRKHSDDCSIRENEISCFSAAANTSCGNNARMFITNMLKIYLCQTHPECHSCNTSAALNGVMNEFLLIMSLIILLLIRYKIL